MASPYAHDAPAGSSPPVQAGRGVLVPERVPPWHMACLAPRATGAYGLVMQRTALPMVLAVALVAGRAGAQTPPAAPAPATPPTLGTTPGASAAPPWTAPAATASPEPPSGTIWLVFGGLGIVGGASSLLSMPACLASRVPSSEHPACLGTSVAVGVALLGGGIGFTVLGAQRRAAWLEWTKGARVGFTPGGAALSWRTSW